MKSINIATAVGLTFISFTGANAGPDINAQSPFLPVTIPAPISPAPPTTATLDQAWSEDSSLSEPAQAPSVPGSFGIMPQYSPYAIPLYGQAWWPWAGDQLGWISGSTIGRYGCALTACAMDRTFFGGYTVNPRDLNVWLKANGGFWADLIIFSRVRGWKGTYDYSMRSADLNTINRLLDQGNLLVAQTYLPPRRTQLHFVLITAHSGYQYSINDPIDGQRSTFSARYGDPARWIYTINAFRGN